MLSIRCPVCPVYYYYYYYYCLSVMFVYCGQAVGRITTKVGTQVGLGPGHIVLDGDPAALDKLNIRHISASGLVDLLT